MLKLSLLGLALIPLSVFIGLRWGTVGAAAGYTVSALLLVAPLALLRAAARRHHARHVLRLPVEAPSRRLRRRRRRARSARGAARAGRGGSLRRSSSFSASRPEGASMRWRSDAHCFERWRACARPRRQRHSRERPSRTWCPPDVRGDLDIVRRDAPVCTSVVRTVDDVARTPDEIALGAVLERAPVDGESFGDGRDRVLDLGLAVRVARHQARGEGRRAAGAPARRTASASAATAHRWRRAWRRRARRSARRA